jgi:vancomycin resistance protein VanJ
MLVNTFLPFAFAPLILTLPLAGLAWSRGAHWLGGLASLSGAILFGHFFLLYGALFLPRLAGGRPGPGPTLLLQTFNVGWDQREPERIAAAVADVNADVVALVEMDEDTSSYLGQALASQYPYVVLEEKGSSGLLSRLEILEVEWIPFGDNPLLLRVVIDWEKTPLTVFVVHLQVPEFKTWSATGVPLGLEDTERWGWVREIRRRALSVAGPVIVMGDFNMAPSNPAYDEIAAYLTDAFRAAGWGFGFTWPQGAGYHGIYVPFRLVRIDYVFHSPDLYPLTVGLGCDSGSDHCYLTVRLRR